MHGFNFLTLYDNYSFTQFWLSLCQQLGFVSISYEVTGTLFECPILFKSLKRPPGSPPTPPPPPKKNKKKEVPIMFIVANDFYCTKVTK